MNCSDLMLTLSAHDQGLLVEANPIAEIILPHGPAALTAFKILLVAFGSFILIRYSKRLLVECLCWALAFVYVGVSIHWLFCYEVYERAVTANDYAGTPPVWLM